MSPLLTSLIAFACIFGGTFLGIYIHHRLPDRHLSGDTRDIVRQGTGLIATLASLVLGLLIASACFCSPPMVDRSRSPSLSC
jgi:hypothetical protein